MIWDGLGMGLLFLHLVCCILVYLGIRLHILNVKPHLMFLVVFVPVWGVLTVLFLHFEIAVGADNEKKVSIEKLRLEDEIHRSIFMENEDTQKEIIPLEEALAINQSKIRRNLIMDVLNNHPEEYIELLDRAKMNEDVEVVHYAATAMAELSKEYDFLLQKKEKQYAAEPDNPKIQEEYHSFLKQYIEQGMAKGQMEVVQRKQYSELLLKILERTESLETYAELAENQMKLGEYAVAAETIQRILSRWPDREDGWMLKLKYFALQQEGQEIQKLLAEMKQKNIYLSAGNKEKISFWQ